MVRSAQRWKTSRHSSYCYTYFLHECHDSIAEQFNTPHFLNIYLSLFEPSLGQLAVLKVGKERIQVLLTFYCYRFKPDLIYFLTINLHTVTQRDKAKKQVFKTTLQIYQISKNDISHLDVY